MIDTDEIFEYLIKVFEEWKAQGIFEEKLKQYGLKIPSDDDKKEEIHIKKDS